MLLKIIIYGRSSHNTCLYNHIKSASLHLSFSTVEATKTFQDRTTAHTMFFATASLFARKPNPWLRYIQKTVNLPELKGKTAPQRAKILSKKWKTLSATVKSNLRK